jgi:Flp pilus assembly protein TadB
VVLPTLDVLLFTMVCGGLGGAILLLAVAVRGTAPDPGRPPSRLARALSRLRWGATVWPLAAACGCAAVVLAFTRWPVAALGSGALVLMWPRIFGGTRAEREQITRLEALVIWTEALRDTMRAHASLEQAIPAAAANAPPVIRPALTRLVGQIGARLPMEHALRGLAAQLDDPSADLIIAALILNVRRRGDGLTAVLGGLAEAARTELDMRRRISAGRAGLRRGVQIVVVITIAFAGFLVVFSRAYVAPYGTSAGQVALAAVIGMFAAGFAWMRRLSGADPVRPFLSRPGQDVPAEDLRLVAGLTGLPSAAVAGLTAEPGAVRRGWAR